MQDGIKGVDEVDVKEESMFVAFRNSKLIQSQSSIQSFSGVSKYQGTSKYIQEDVQSHIVELDF